MTAHRSQMLQDPITVSNESLLIHEIFNKHNVNIKIKLTLYLYLNSRKNAITLNKSAFNGRLETNLFLRNPAAQLLVLLT